MNLPADCTCGHARLSHINGGKCTRCGCLTFTETGRAPAPPPLAWEVVDAPVSLTQWVSPWADGASGP